MSLSHKLSRIGCSQCTDQRITIICFMQWHIIVLKVGSECKSNYEWCNHTKFEIKFSQERGVMSPPPLSQQSRITISRGQATQEVGLSLSYSTLRRHLVLMLAWLLQYSTKCTKCFTALPIMNQRPVGTVVRVLIMNFIAQL